ncbi:hypothetical protein Kompost2_00011 [Pseudomonas phage vB_PpuP-Kompost-2]
MRSDFRHRVYPVTPTKSIKFRATFPKAESYGLHQVKEVVFALGLGPCGKHVLRLEHTITEDLLTITQTSRHPDDLEEPGGVWSAKYKLERHERAVDQMMRDRPMARLYIPEYRVVSGFLWWAKYEEIKPEPLPEMPPPEGLLEPAEKAALELELRELYKAHADWRDRLEVKTFVYKMTDVHGRIETIK